MAERDITSQRFGALVAVKRAPGATRHIRWLFRCDCGTESEMFKSNVTRGHINSCVECGHKRQNVAVMRHGAATRRFGRTPEYKIYQAAKFRCQNPNDARYADYGGRGIQFRFKSFQHFMATVGPRPAGRNITLDRLNNDGHYEPKNVTWVPMQQNATHRRPHSKL